MKEKSNTSYCSAILITLFFASLAGAGAQEAATTTRGLLGEPRDTTGAAPPADAYVLFGPDGDLSWWLNAGNPKKEIGWQLENGEMTVTPRTGSITARLALRDFITHIEFSVPEGEGNSGVYLQGRYEIQVLNSFGHGPSSTGCGGLYNKKAPAINAARPPGEWQSFDMAFRAARWENGRKTANARITVTHNGTLIHDDAEIDSETGAGAEENPEPRSVLFLQDHGCLVKFRNIWVKPLPPCPCLEAEPPDAAKAADALKTASATEKTLILTALPVYAPAAAPALLQEYLADKNPAVRVTAVQAASILKDNAPVEAIRKMLEDKSGEVRLAALLALGRLGKTASLESIQNMLADEDAHVRLTVLRTVRRIGGVDAIPLLAEAACSVDSDTRSAARASLAALSGEGVDKALVASAADEAESEEVRAEIIAALAARGITAAVPKLFALARAKEKPVRKAARSALGALAEPASTPELIALTADAADDEERAASADALAAVITRAGTPEQAVALVASACDSAQTQQRMALLRALSKIGGAKALEPVRNALKDKDSAVASAALRAMAEWPDAAPLEELRGLATDSTNKDDRAAALAGHIRLIALKNELAPAEKVKLYEAAMELAEREAEKRLVYEGLAGTPAVETLASLEQYLEELRAFGEEQLLPAAEKAYVDAAIGLIKSKPKEAKDALMRFCGACENKELVERAKKAIKGE